MSIFREVPLGVSRMRSCARRDSGCADRGHDLGHAGSDEACDGSFHEFTCPDCRSEYSVDGPLIYTDFDRKHWIGEFPRAWEGSWELLEHQPLETFGER